jgi:hypothetical protein
MKEIVLFGGYGTFGTLIAHELVPLGVPLVIAGRDVRRATALSNALATTGTPARPLVADATRSGEVDRALANAAVAVVCAGPISQLGVTVLEACLAHGCHYVDITDDRRHARIVRAATDRFRARALSAVYGCSSLPSISGALAHVLAASSSARAVRARVALLIGNRSPKGGAAIGSAVATIGKMIEAPQGVLRGFRDPELITLPEPYGTKKFYNIDTPEYDLLPLELGVAAVTAKVRLELASANLTFSLLARLGSHYERWTARALGTLGIATARLGTSCAVIQADLFFPDDSSRSASLVSTTEGQRMAALPCSLVVDRLIRDATCARGADTAYGLLGAQALVDGLVAHGMAFSLN